MARTIIVNNRNLVSHVTGVQRYTIEIEKYFPESGMQYLAPQHGAGVKGHLWEQLILPILLKKYPDCVLWGPGNTGPLAVRNQVVSIHDMNPFDNPETLNPRFAKWYQFLLPRLARASAHIITVSKFSKQRIVEGLGVAEEKVSVVYNGVDAKFSPVDGGNELVRGKLGIDTSKYILCVGSIEPRKNLSRLFQAWTKVQHLEEFEDCSLVVSGTSGSSNIFKNPELKINSRKIKLLGYVADDDLPALYSGAESFAYVSEYEGFGLPALEAMACGTIPVVSNVTSLPEVVGPNGIYVDPFSVDSIAAGLVDSMRADTRKQFDFELMRAAAKRFDWRVASGEIYQILNNV